MESMWPDFMTGDLPTPPTVILHRQADLLTEMTGGRMVGSVVTKPLGKDFVHTLFITTPGLGDYEHLVVRVRHSMSHIYPVKLSMSEKEERSRECNNQEEFLALFQKILEHPQTVGPMRLLYAQTA